jgi:hypothetical protein
MAKDSLPPSSRSTHPKKANTASPGTAIHQNGDNGAELVIDEEIKKVLHHIESKLPPEILERLNVSGNIKELLHNYYNQNFQNMLNRYLVTVEDEMSKKVSSLVDDEEKKNLNQYSSKSIVELIEKLGKGDSFLNSNIDQPIVSIYSNLQNQLNRQMDDLACYTQKLLRGRSGIGAFVRGENAYSIVKCILSDNYLKPETVADIDLVINITNTELLNPIFHYQVVSDTIVREILSDRITTLIDKEIDKLNEKFSLNGQQELNESDRLFEKLKRLEKFYDEDGIAYYDNPAVENFLQAIKGQGPEIDREDFDPLSIRANVQKIVDDENMRTRGFNKAVNAITGILDSSRLGYQHIESYKNSRKVVIREYADTNNYALPDERYTVTLSYYDNLQLREMRTAYCQQIEEFEAETQKLWSVLGSVYEVENSSRGTLGYDDISAKILGAENIVRSSTLQGVKAWDETSFINPDKSSQERIDEAFASIRPGLKKKFSRLRRRIKELYKFENPTERIIMDQRLDFIENKFELFNRSFNPFHVQPGLVVEVTLSTIKRQEITMSGMSNVLDEFLACVSKGFIDNAVEEYAS